MEGNGREQQQQQQQHDLLAYAISAAAVADATVTTDGCDTKGGNADSSSGGGGRRCVVVREACEGLTASGLLFNTCSGSAGGAFCASWHGPLGSSIHTLCSSCSAPQQLPIRLLM